MVANADIPSKMITLAMVLVINVPDQLRSRKWLTLDEPPMFRLVLYVAVHHSAQSRLIYIFRLVWDSTLQTNEKKRVIIIIIV